MSFCYNLEKGLFDGEFNSQNERPFLAINWNVIGRCVNNCEYCYGDDIRGLGELSENSTNDLISAIIDLYPDLIVLTGGEPLIHKQYKNIVRRIKDKGVNFILDTSAVIDMKDDIENGLYNGVHLRISLDSSEEEINGKIRKSQIKNSAEIVKNNIFVAVKHGLSLTVQTTITEGNFSSLEKLGSFLTEVGVKNWRLSVVIPHSEELNDKAQKEYERLKGLFKNLQIRLSNAIKSDKNHIVLVDPKGNLWVRNSKNNIKTMVGSLLTDKISREELIKNIDLELHCRRYKG